MNKITFLAVAGAAALFAQPAVTSLSPLVGSGASAVFTAVYSHPGGINKQYLGYLLVLPSPNIVWFTAKGSCLVEYNRISNGVRLINDQGDGWLGRPEGEPAGPGGRVLTNSWCSVDTRNVHATLAGTNMTVTYPLTFLGTFTGQMGTFLQALDVTGAWTGMTQFGNWTPYTLITPRPGPYVTDVQVTYPTQSALAPSRVQVFTGNTLSNGGNASVTNANILIAEKIVGSPVRCHLMYVHPARQLWLLNDAGTDWIKTQPPHNNTCSVVGTGTSITWNDVNGTITMDIRLSWTAGAVTRKLNAWANTFDDKGNLTHWMQ